MENKLIILEDRLFEEINRHRVLVGLPILLEAVMGGIVSKIIEFIEPIARIADDDFIDIERYAATGDLYYVNELKRYRENLTTIATRAGLRVDDTMSARQILELLSISDNVLVKEKLIKYLCSEFSSVREAVAKIIKEDPIVKSRIGNVKPSAFRKTLEDEYGIYGNVQNDIIKTLYPEMSENLQKLMTKMGLNIDNTQRVEQRAEILDGLQRAAGDPELAQNYKYIKADEAKTQAVNNAYNTAMVAINEMDGGITYENAVKYFSKEFTKIVDTLRVADKLQPKWKMHVKQIGNNLKNFYKWIFNTNWVMKAKNPLGRTSRAAAAGIFAIIMSWATVCAVVSFFVASLYRVWLNDEEKKKEYIKTKRGFTELSKAKATGDWSSFENDFAAWNTPVIHWVIEFSKYFTYPFQGLKLGGSASEPTTDEQKKDLLKFADEYVKGNSGSIDKYENKVESFKTWASKQTPVITVTTDPKVTTDAVTTLYDVNGFIYKWCAIKNTFFADDKYMNECK